MRTRGGSGGVAFWLMGFLGPVGAQRGQDARFAKRFPIWGELLWSLLISVLASASFTLTCLLVIQSARLDQEPQMQAAYRGMILAAFIAVWCSVNILELLRPAQRPQ